MHEALRERGLLATRLAPHLVRPVPFLVPLPPRPVARRCCCAGYYGAGVAAYDAFAGLFGRGRGMPLHRHLSRDRGPAAVPVAAGDAASAGPSSTTTARSTTPGWWSRWPAPRPAWARPWSPARAVRFLRRRARGDRGPRGGRRDGGEFDVRAPDGDRRHRRVERRRGRDAAADGGPFRPGLRVRASKGVHIGGAAVGDHRRGRADPAHRHLGAVRHPVGRALDHRHHRHRLAARPGPPGRVGPRHRVPAGPGQRGAGPAAVHCGHRGRVRRAAAAAGRGGRAHLDAVPRARRGGADARAAAGGRRQAHDVPGDGRRRGGRRASRPAGRRPAARAPTSCRCWARTGTPG